MQQKSAAWYAALTSASAEWMYGLDILASDEATLLEDPTVYDEFAADRLIPKSGQIILDTTSKVQRTFALGLRNSDGRYLVGPAGYPSGGQNSPIATGLTWFTARYRPWIKLRTGFDSSGNPIWDTTYLGIFLLASPSAYAIPSGDYVTLNLTDKASLLCAPNLITNATLPTYTLAGTTVGGFAAGTTYDAAMTSLATSAGVPASRISFEPSALTLPANYAVSEGDEPWTILQTLANAMSHVIYFDVHGTLIRRSNPLSINAASVYTFAPGPQSIIAKLERDTDLNNTYNHVIVIGASSTTGTVRGEAQVQDTSSLYHESQIGDRIVFVGSGGVLGDMTPDPAISTTGQANTVASTILAQHIGQNETLTITARNLPALEEYDRITVTDPNSGLALDFLVTGILYNLAHDGMVVTASRFFAVGS